MDLRVCDADCVVDIGFSLSLFFDDVGGIEDHMLDTVRDSCRSLDYGQVRDVLLKDPVILRDAVLAKAALQKYHDRKMSA